MKISVDLPDELVRELKLRAVHEGKKLKDAVADVLRKGLAAVSVGSATVVKADKGMTKRRREIAKKFVSGEWGVELAGFEAGQAADRASAKERDNRWRK